jgi:hypothetical protein
MYIFVCIHEFCSYQSLYPVLLKRLPADHSGFLTPRCGMPGKKYKKKQLVNAI